MSVSIVFRKDKLNKKNEGPINFFIVKNRKLTKVSTGISVPEDAWDFTKNRVKGKHPNSARLNSLLQHKFTELQDSVYEHETHNKSLSSKNLRDLTFGKRPSNFFDYAEEVIQGYLNDGKVGTYDNNKSVMTKLSNYLGHRNLSFHDITPEFLFKYETHLKTKLNNKINTVHKDLKFFKKLFNHAYANDVIEHSANPFRKFKIKTEKTTKNYLLPEELNKIEEFIAPRGEVIMKHKDMFIFATNAGGLRVSDLLLLRCKNFDGTHLHFIIKKTGEQASIKLTDKALKIIKKYIKKDAIQNDFIFSCLHNDLDVNNPRDLDLALSRSTAIYNKNLKIIAAKQGIDKNLSSHICRHSFATLALRNKIPLQNVSKILGHSSVKITQVYAKIVNDELDKSMDSFKY
jgi:site-specific recombinase XerD